MTANTAYDALMDEICVGLGVCGCIKDGRPSHVRQFIPSRGPVTADQFAEWVFLADDMNPYAEPKSWENLKEKIKRAFIRHMGAEVVDARVLKWSDGKPEKQRRFVDEPLYRKVEVWRRLSAERAIRYNCIQHLQSGEFRVCTADFVEAVRVVGGNAERKRTAADDAAGQLRVAKHLHENLLAVDAV